MLWSPVFSYFTVFYVIYGREGKSFLTSLAALLGGTSPKSFFYVSKKHFILNINIGCTKLQYQKIQITQYGPSHWDRSYDFLNTILTFSDKKNEKLHFSFWFIVKCLHLN